MQTSGNVHRASGLGARENAAREVISRLTGCSGERDPRGASASSCVRWGCYSLLAQSGNVQWGQAWQGLRAAPRPACPEGGGISLTGGKLEGGEALLTPAWTPRRQVLGLGFDSAEESPPLSDQQMDKQGLGVLEEA